MVHTYLADYVLNIVYHLVERYLLVRGLHRGIFLLQAIEKFGNRLIKKILLFSLPQTYMKKRPVFNPLPYFIDTNVSSILDSSSLRAD